jgi:cation diffusion facilitator family transporter
MDSTKAGVYAAILGNCAIAITKFVAATIAGSSAMLSEGFHSLVDTGDGILLLVGMRVSSRPPDETHPFGHGKELYFYTLIVSVLIFGVGGGVSIYEGILHVLSPAAATNLRLNFIVFGLATLFESISLAVALRGFRRAKGRQSTWQALRRSKDPTTFVVPFEDSAALMGLAVAALGVFLSHQLQMPVFDGIASIVIGTILCAVAAVLLRESKGLLVGESAEPGVLATIRRVAGAAPAVSTVGRVLTMHLGPEEILVNLEVQFRHDASSSELAAGVEKLERNLRHAEPRVRHIFIEATSLAAAGTKPAHTPLGQQP